MIGAGAVHVWVEASTPNVDLQATVSEVRPDGMETFVQDGWLRADERALDQRASTPLAPVLNLRKARSSRCPRGALWRSTIPLYYEGHAYRAGSRIRVTISAPGGHPAAVGLRGHRIRRAPRKLGRALGVDPSSLVLPVVPG